MYCEKCKREMTRVCQPTFPPIHGYKCMSCGRTIYEETRADSEKFLAMVELKRAKIRLALSIGLMLVVIVILLIDKIAGA